VSIPQAGPWLVRRLVHDCRTRSLTVRRAAVNRWVSGSVHGGVGIRGAEIDIASFQSLPKHEESGLK